MNLANYHQDIEPVGAAMVALEAWRAMNPEHRSYVVSRFNDSKVGPQFGVFLFDVRLPKPTHIERDSIPEAVRDALAQHAGASKV